MGWNDPTGHFGQGAGAKGGVVPAQSGVLPAPKFLVAHSATSMLFNTSFTRRVNRMVNGLVIRVFHAPVTLLKF